MLMCEQLTVQDSKVSDVQFVHPKGNVGTVDRIQAR